MTKINFSALAINDLKDIKTYINEDLCDEKASNNVISSILASIKMLNDYPQSGSPLSSIINIDTDYRFLVCDNYKVFYKYENNVVNVYRIINSRRDFMQILFKDIND